MSFDFGPYYKTFPDFFTSFDKLIYVVLIYFSFASSSETPSTLDKVDIDEKPTISSLVDPGSEAGKDGREEDNTAPSDGIMTAGTPASHPKGESV